MGNDSKLLLGMPVPVLALGDDGEDLSKQKWCSGKNLNGPGAGCRSGMRCRCSAACLLWYAVVVCTGLTLLLRNVGDRGAHWLGLVAGDSFADSVLGMGMGMGIAQQAQADWVPESREHIPGTSLYGVAVSPARQHVDCFFSSGKWVYDPAPRYMVPVFLSSNSLRRCDSAFLKEVPGAVAGDDANAVVARIAAGNASAADWIVRDGLKWDWHTDQARCPLLPVDREDLCRRIGSHRNVLVVGDSINQELYWTLLNHLVGNRTGWRVPRSSIERYVQGDEELCADVLGGPGLGFRVGHVRNDRLSLTLRYLEDKHANFYEHPWVNVVEPWNISLFIFNRGAHFEPDEDYAESLTNVYSVIRSRWPDAQVFFRSTPPGHVNCTSYQGPVPERQSEETLAAFNPGRYHWAEFARQNAIARRITESFGHVFLDLEAPMAFRPDSHLSATDCLHYCMPGPLDVFAKLFYNAMRLLNPHPGPAQAPAR